jgi:uncharacterized protein YkwD
MRIRVRLAALTMAGMMSWCSAYGQTATLRAEQELFASVNQVRRAQGLSPLRWDESLAAVARRHAEAMAEHGSARHGFEGEPSLSARVKQAGAHFSWLSENVTQGPSPQFIHTQFMKSPPHRANILDRDMDSIGVGVVEQGGQLFAVEDLSQAR